MSNEVLEESDYEEAPDQPSGPCAKVGDVWRVPNHGLVRVTKMDGGWVTWSDGYVSGPWLGRDGGRLTLMRRKDAWEVGQVREGPILNAGWMEAKDDKAWEPRATYRVTGRDPRPGTWKVECLSSSGQAGRDYYCVHESTPSLVLVPAPAVERPSKIEVGQMWLVDGADLEVVAVSANDWKSQIGSWYSQVLTLKAIERVYLGTKKGAVATPPAPAQDARPRCSEVESRSGKQCQVRGAHDDHEVAVPTWRGSETVRWRKAQVVKLKAVGVYQQEQATCAWTTTRYERAGNGQTLKVEERLCKKPRSGVGSPYCEEHVAMDMRRVAVPPKEERVPRQSVNIGVGLGVWSTRSAS